MSNKSVKYPIKAKKKRRKARKKLARVVILLGLLSLVGWLFYKTINYSYQTFVNNIVKVQEIQTTTFIATERLDGIVFRDEILLIATESGQVILLVEEGELVDAQTAVVQIHDSKQVEQLIARLAELDKRLEDYSQETGAGVAALEQQISALEEVIRDRIGQLRQQPIPAIAMQLEQEIADLNNQRLVMSGKKGSYDDVRNDILDQIEGVQAQLAATEGNVKTPVGGFVAFSFDGYETQLRISEMDSFGKELFVQQFDTWRIEDSGNIQAGQPLFKIVADDPWYWLAVMDEPTAQALDAVVQLRTIGDHQPIDALLHAIRPLEGGSVLVTFEIEQMLIDAMATRQLSLEIIKRQAEGVVIPKNSVITKQDKDGVMLLVDGTVHFIPISVVDQHGDQLLLGDQLPLAELVLNPRWVRDAQKINIRR